MRKSLYGAAALAVVLAASMPVARAQMGGGMGMGGGGAGMGGGVSRSMMQGLVEHMMEHEREGDFEGMGPGRRGGGNMGPGMRSRGMMGPGMTGAGQGMGASQRLMGFGGRVVPSLKLTVEDVTDAFKQRLERIGNKRLKLGPVKAVDKDTITVDIVTVDNSLVERLKVNRRNGIISRAEAG